MLRPFRSAAPWVIAALIATLGSPGLAHAWTRSIVTAASADLEVREAGELRVVLRIGLQVQGGWLSSFDVAGLEPDLVLDPSAAAWLVSRSDGRVYTPQVSTSAPGRISVGFSNRRDAPWRGDYELGLVYTARSPVLQGNRPAPGRLGIAWQMPAWDRGLEDVRVRITGNGSVEALLDPELAHTVRLGESGGDTRSAIELRRVQLPRATPWTVQFSVPESSVRVPKLVVDEAAPDAAPSASRTEPPALVLAALIALLAMVKHRSVDRVARLRGARALSVVPMPAWLRLLGIWGLCGLGGCLGSDQLGLAVSSWGAAVVLALHRGVQPLTVGRRLAGARRLRSIDAGRLEELSELLVGRAWLDLTTPVGVALAGSLLGLGLAVYGLPHGSDLPLLGALLLLPLFVSGTRLHLPIGRAARLRILARTAAELGTALQCRATLLTTGNSTDVRLRISLPDARLDELAIVVHDVAWLGRTRSVTALCVRSCADPVADELLVRALPGALRTASEHGVEWLQPTGTPAADLANLLGWLDTLPEQRAAA